MLTRRHLLAASIALATTGCARSLAQRPGSGATVGTAGSTLTEIVERHFEAELALNPTTATAIGDDRYDDRLERTASREYVGAKLNLDLQFLNEVATLDVEQLSPADRLTYDVFVRERREGIARAHFADRLLPLDQMSSMPTLLALYGSGGGPQPFATEQHYARWLARARQFPTWVEDAIDAMREGMRSGVTQPRVVMERVVPQLDALVVADPEQSLFYNPVRMIPDAWPTATRDALARDLRALVVDTLNPAYSRLSRFVRDEYLPACRTSVGWSELPDGKRWYAHRVALFTTVNLPPDEIHSIGLAEVARIRSEMGDVMRQVGFEGDLQAFFAHVMEAPGFHFDKPEDLLEGYRVLKRRIDSLLPKLFSEFPKADYEVRAVEPFRAQSAAGASYQAPSADGKRPGIFYVNTFNLKAQPKYGMETLSLHEAAPGHHFQIASQQELTNLPRFRRFGGYVAYSEGWALYAESLGRELGLFTDPMQYYGRLNDEMLRAMRLVVDTGLHAKGWSREQAIAYMRDNSSLAESDVIAEVERYIVWPGQALGYKLGQIRISAMRANAERELGARFDVREFHREVLKDGSLPIDVLEAKIGRWIDRQR